MWTLVLRTFIDRKIKINHSIPDSAIYVNGNDLVQDVFDNILGNALKHNRTGNDVIDISHNISDDGKYWKFEFKDRGPGVPDPMKGNIFKRLQRGEESVYGSGLGLTISREIVNRFGGDIWVEDRVSGASAEGSNFVVKLFKCD